MHPDASDEVDALQEERPVRQVEKECVTVRRPRHDELHDERRRHEGREGAAVDLGDLYAASEQTFQASFSAVSKPNFASKYSLESSRRDLHNPLLCTALKAQFFH